MTLRFSATQMTVTGALRAQGNSSALVRIQTTSLTPCHLQDILTCVPVEMIVQSKGSLRLCILTGLTSVESYLNNVVAVALY